MLFRVIFCLPCTLSCQPQHKTKGPVQSKGNKKFALGRRDGLAVRNTPRSYRRPWFNSQHWQDGLQPSVTPVSEGLDVPLWPLQAPSTHVVYIYTCGQNTHKISRSFSRQIKSVFILREANSRRKGSWRPRLIGSMGIPAAVHTLEKLSRWPLRSSNAEDPNQSYVALSCQIPREASLQLGRAWTVFSVSQVKKSHLIQTRAGPTTDHHLL